MVRVWLGTPTTYRRNNLLSVYFLKKRWGWVVGVIFGWVLIFFRGGIFMCVADAIHMFSDHKSASDIGALLGVEESFIALSIGHIVGGGSPFWGCISIFAECGVSGFGEEAKALIYEDLSDGFGEAGADT